MICPNCNSQNMNDAGFCSKCGMKLGETAVVSGGHKVESCGKRQNMVGQIIKAMSIIFVIVGFMALIALSMLDIEATLTPRNDINIEAVLKLSGFDGKIFGVGIVFDFLVGFIMYAIGEVIDRFSNNKG